MQKTGWTIHSFFLVLSGLKKSFTLDVITRGQSTTIFLCIGPFSAWWRTNKRTNEQPGDPRARFYVNACYSRALKIITTPFYNFMRDPNQLKGKPLNSRTISSSGEVSPYTEPASCLGTIKGSKVIFGHSLNSRQTPTCPCNKGCLGVICFPASLVGI